MSIKKILILGAVLPFIATAAHANDALQADALEFEMLMDMYYNSYKHAVPTSKVADIPEILSGERQAMIKNVGDCASQLDGFGGLEIRHEPKYLVAVKFQKSARMNLKSCTK